MRNKIIIWAIAAFIFGWILDYGVADYRAKISLTGKAIQVGNKVADSLLKHLKTENNGK